MIPTIKDNKVIGYGLDGNGECIIPDGVKSINKYAFYGCNELKRIDVPDSVEEIGEEAFYSCDSLTDIILPKKLIVIENKLLACCINLKNISIPDNVRIIRAGAFGQCLGLENINMPNSVFGINSIIFEHCLSLINFNTGEQGFDALCLADKYLVISNFAKKYSGKNTYTQDDINRYKNFILLTKQQWTQRLANQKLLFNLECNGEMTTEHGRTYKDYIIDTQIEEIKQTIKNDVITIIKDESLLNFICRNMDNIFTVSEIDKLIDISCEIGETGSTALLMNYKFEHFEYPNPSKDNKEITKSKNRNKRRNK